MQCFEARSRVCHDTERHLAYLCVDHCVHLWPPARSVLPSRTGAFTRILQSSINGGEKNG